MINSGIYCIINKINNHRYIGSAKDLKRRKSGHFRELRSNEHINIYLQRAYNKYGEANFEFQVIELVSDKSILIEREQFWIDYIISTFGRSNLYNICLIANSVIGLTWTLKKETLKKRKKHRSKETKNKLRLANIGRKFSEEHRKKLALAKLGSNNPLYGKHHSEKTLRKKRRSMLAFYRNTSKFRKKQISTTIN